MKVKSKKRSFKGKIFLEDSPSYERCGRNSQTQVVAKMGGTLDCGRSTPDRTLLAKRLDRYKGI